ncbi:MAG: hypothetical protein JW737_06835 [Acidobacteria bacterium]|nr:hypothetical protein [Acidobacteriota bacterium]
MRKVNPSSVILIILAISVAFPSILSSQSKMVILFKLKNYSGKSIAITKNIPDLRDSEYKFNDMASSLQMRGVSSIAVYENVNYTGKCQTFRSDQKNLSDSTIGANQISSIKLDAECLVRGPVVMLFEHIRYGGKFVEINDDEPNLGKEKFNDKASSLKLYGIDSIAVYEDKDFWGKCQTYTKDQISLANNDTMSSLRINKKCEDYIQITVKNNSPAFVYVSYPGLPQLHKELTGGMRHSFILTTSYPYNFVRLDNIDITEIGSGTTTYYKICEYESFTGGKTYKISVNGFINQHCVLTEE